MSREPPRIVPAILDAAGGAGAGRRRPQSDGTENSPMPWRGMRGPGEPPGQPARSGPCLPPWFRTLSQGPHPHPRLRDGRRPHGRCRICSRRRRRIWLGCRYGDSGVEGWEHTASSSARRQPYARAILGMPFATAGGFKCFRREVLRASTRAVRSVVPFQSNSRGVPAGWIPHRGGSIVFPDRVHGVKMSMRIMHEGMLGVLRMRFPETAQGRAASRLIQTGRVLMISGRCRSRRRSWTMAHCVVLDHVAALGGVPLGPALHHVADGTMWSMVESYPIWVRASACQVQAAIPRHPPWVRARIRGFRGQVVVDHLR